MDLGASLLGLFIIGVVKVAVMSMSGWLVVRVYRLTAPKHATRLHRLVPRNGQPGLRELYWAMVLFAASELTCGVETYILFRSNILLTGTHALTSAAGMAFFALGLVEYFDSHLFRFAEPGCAAKKLCGVCTVHTSAGCKYRGALLLLGTFVLLAGALPLTASTELMVADSTRFLLPFPAVNAYYDQVVVPYFTAHLPGYQRSGAAFVLPPSMWYVELRFLPLVSMGCTLFVLQRFRAGAVASGVRILSVAAGVLGYVYFELILYRGTGDVLLGSLAHEIAEFWFLLFTAEFLRRSFEAQVAPRSPAAPRGLLISRNSAGAAGQASSQTDD